MCLRHSSIWILLETFDELQRSLVRYAAKRAYHTVSTTPQILGWLVSSLSSAVDALRGARSTLAPICGASGDLPDRPQRLTELKVVRSVALCWEMGVVIAGQRVPTGQSPLICAEELARDRAPKSGQNAWHHILALHPSSDPSCCCFMSGGRQVSFTFDTNGRKDRVRASRLTTQPCARIRRKTRLLRMPRRRCQSVRGCSRSGTFTVCMFA